MQKFHLLKTNFDKLDEIIGGFLPGEITVIGSRPAIGKTSFISSLIQRMIPTTGNSSLFFSLEMPAAYFCNRLVSTMLKIDYMKFVQENLSDNEKMLVNKQLHEIRDWPLYIKDNPNQTIDDICKISRKYVRRQKVKIIFIDYLGLIAPKDETMPVYENISQIMHKLKILARELNVAIVVACQVSRCASPSDPELSDLSGSGAIEDIADVIVFISRENRQYPEQAKLIVAKNHHGDLGEIYCRFSCGKFEEIPFTPLPETEEDVNE